MPGATQRGILVTVVCLLGCASAQARPAHKRALTDYYGPLLAKRLVDCRTCHVPDGAAGSDVSEKPHNAFGARLKAVKQELRRAGKPSTLVARLEAIALEDSDGDGVPNVLELLSGHAPGDPNDTPTPAEVRQARQVLAAFLEAKQAYPWTPFEKVTRPTIPTVHNVGWIRNPIDAFVAAEHERHGLTPRPAADRATLLRRLSLDLVGLPPTPEELHAFLGDDRPDAYERVVERMLASPQYGERWGRHWMDVWRYSDWAGWSDGGQIRDSQPHIWRWRDWIVEALNRDKGYDRMILEMLAADELAPEDPDALRATGYLVRNYKMLSREKWMQDTVDHTAMAFLGVTLGCARCHDHMYDPITQREYYQVRAVFEPEQVRIDRVPGQSDIKKAGLARAYDGSPSVKTFLYVRGDERTPEKTALAPGVPEALGGKHFEAVSVALPLTAYVPDKRGFVEDEAIAHAAVQLERAGQTSRAAERSGLFAAVRLLAGDGVPACVRLADAQQLLDASALAEAGRQLAEAEQSSLLRTLAVERLEDHGDRSSAAWQRAAAAATGAQRHAAVAKARRDLLAARLTSRPAVARIKEDPRKKVTEAEAALRQAESQERQPPTTAYTHRSLTSYAATSTGRRLAFARWIADRDNPLTARVAMNHIWLRHFGEAIVPSVFDFGRNGRPPSHPALLDWLAAELMEQGWSMKALHRLIVTSSTYRMASTVDQTDLAVDADNRYLWRLLPRRVEAEVVRDCLFYAAGRLDCTMGGPEIDHHDGLTVPRRSLYFRHAAEKQMEFLKLFDAASVTECYQRRESIVPQQALALANSELTRKQAKLLASKLTVETGEDAEAFVIAAFEHLLSRPPTAAEKAECLGFLCQQGHGLAQAKANRLQRYESLIHVLLNHHEFVTVR
jgi:hypothetical protein